MIQLSEDHSDISVIGVGAHRACYIHPNDPQKCIKIIYNPSEIALKEIKREFILLQAPKHVLERLAWHI